MKILVGGDFTPKKVISTLINNGDFMFFDQLKQLISQITDISIINMESPFKSVTDNPIDKYGPNLGCTPKTVNALKYAGISAVTLANNHVLDFGAEALSRTKLACEEFGIRTVGAGANLYEASKPLYVEKKGQVLAIINCCEHEFSVATSASAGTNPLNPIAQYYTIREAKKKAEYVLVIVHGGHERFNLPSLRMQETYRFFIDAGADAVINHHQHCFSGYEIYNGRPIFYGLGNLCFENKTSGRSDWNMGYMVNLEFKGSDVLFKIYPYEQCVDLNCPEVKFLSADTFDEELRNLNTIIADQSLLSKANKEYYDSFTESAKMILSVYNNRYLRKLSKMHLLPRFLSKLQLLKFTDHIVCESHRDKITHFLQENALKN